MVWNYTTLKPAVQNQGQEQRFTTLWNYTTLKQTADDTPILPVLLPYEITLLSNAL